jgi:hypothetical protein
MSTLEKIQWNFLRVKMDKEYLGKWVNKFIEA